MLWSVDRCEGLRYKTSPNISLLFATLCGGALLLSTQTGNCSKYCLLAFPPDLEHSASTRHPPDRVTDDMLPLVTPRDLHGPETTTDYLKAKLSGDATAPPFFCHTTDQSIWVLSAI